MRGIPEDKAIEIGEQIDSCKYLECSVKDWLRDECSELQEPWMTLDEFLKSGFDGECWICLNTEEVYRATYMGAESGFRNIHANSFRWAEKKLTHVMPIHKPEHPND